MLRTPHATPHVTPHVTPHATHSSFFWVSALCLVALYLGAPLAPLMAAPPAPSTQEDSADESSSTPSQSEWRVTLGGSAGAHGVFLTKPSDEYYYAEGGGVVDIAYPGFGGVGPAFGLDLTLAWRMLSLSTGYHVSLDSAQGKVDGFMHTLEQTSYHVPLTLNVTVYDEGSVRPVLFGGLEWVSGEEGSLKSSQSYNSFYQGLYTEDYRAWTFGLGFDVVMSGGWRVPVRLYGSFHPDERETLNDVITGETVTSDLGFVNASGAQVRGAWTWQAGLRVGLSYDLYAR